LLLLFAGLLNLHFGFFCASLQIGCLLTEDGQFPRYS